MLRAGWPCALLLSLLLGGGVAACQGCGTGVPDANSGDASAAQPTIRLFLVSTLAGAMEPCGCTKDQLGGVDHLAALVARDRGVAKGALVIGAGPLLFMDPVLDGDRATQTAWKADALAAALKEIGLAGWAPGYNDWAAGAEALGTATATAGAQLFASNLDGTPLAKQGAKATVREVAGVKVGIVGVSDPRNRAGGLPAGVTARPSLEAMRAGVAEAKQKGAQVIVGVAALPRGEALRIADEVGDLAVLLVGKPHEAGDINDAPKSPQMVGKTLVVETANHLQTVGVVDLFVAPGPTAEAQITFADAGGVARGEELVALSKRIRDLEARINGWENDKNVKPEDVAARKADLAKMRADKAALEKPQPAPPGSYFRYSMVEVRAELGVDDGVAKAMLAYYKRVNDHNKTAFADRKPPPPEKGKAGYVGNDECATCHEDAKKVWDGTPHAHAYATLEKEFKEFNLDCVSCHVTGYGKPGGSTVTFVESLKNVGCEECHGPGSLHAASQLAKDIIKEPDPQACVSACHHPPHVEGFDPVAKMKLVLGPGHGMPLAGGPPAPSGTPSAKPSATPSAAPSASSGGKAR
jgi:hypothetical protein